MTELKPCPYCGKEAILYDELRRRNGRFRLEISCIDRYALPEEIEGERCFVSPCVSRMGEIKEEVEQAVVEAWNTRPNPWHTGTPTEYGLYLVQYIHGGYDVVLYDPSASGWDIYSDDSPKDIVKWQKIEEKENG